MYLDSYQTWILFRQTAKDVTICERANHSTPRARNLFQNGERTWGWNFGDDDATTEKRQMAASFDWNNGPFIMYSVKPDCRTTCCCWTQMRQLRLSRISRHSSAFLTSFQRHQLRHMLNSADGKRFTRKCSRSSENLQILLTSLVPA